MIHRRADLHIPGRGSSLQSFLRVRTFLRGILRLYRVNDALINRQAFGSRPRGYNIHPRRGSRLSETVAQATRFR